MGGSRGGPSVCPPCHAYAAREEGIGRFIRTNQESAFHKPARHENEHTRMPLKRLSPNHYRHVCRSRLFGRSHVNVRLKPTQRRHVRTVSSSTFQTRETKQTKRRGVGGGEAGRQVCGGLHPGKGGCTGVVCQAWRGEA